MVDLTAPATMSVGGTSYAFVFWVIDNVTQPSGQATIQVTMGANHTVLAQYDWR